MKDDDFREGSSYGVACNICLPDKAFRLNSKCIILWHTGGGNSILVKGLSKSGRQISKWIKIKKCENFRPVYINNKEVVWLGPLGTKEQMKEAADYINRCK